MNKLIIKVIASISKLEFFHWLARFITRIIFSTNSMVSKEFQRIMRVIWEQIKPLLRFLLTVTVIMSIAILFMLFIWRFNLNDTAFLILVIADISIIAIFAIGLVIVGVRHVFTDLIKKEDVACKFCGEIIKSGTNVCLNCGKDSRNITDST